MPSPPERPDMENVIRGERSAQTEGFFSRYGNGNGKENENENENGNENGNGNGDGNVIEVRDYPSEILFGPGLGKPRARDRWPDEKAFLGDENADESSRVRVFAEPEEIGNDDEKVQGRPRERDRERDRIRVLEPNPQPAIAILDTDEQLHRAAAAGDVPRAQMLISQGANPRHVDRRGRTPLHRACARGSLDMIAFLLRQDPETKDLTDFRGNTPLHIVCGERKRDSKEIDQAMRLFISDGADVNARRDVTDGATALHIVGQKEDEAGLKATRLLLENGADVDSKDNSGRTPLHTAAEDGNKKTAEILLQSNASVDAVDEQGRSALHLCLASEDIPMIKVLLRFGADVNIKNDRGYTALHEICRNNWASPVQLLLASGADLQIKTKDGLTAEQLAEKRGAGEIFAALREWQDKEAPTAPEQIQAEHTQEVIFEPKQDSLVWAGVRRDNGDGFILANYDNHDISFDAKLESIYPAVHEGQDMHEIQIKLNFMRPYSMDHRIRYANVDVLLEGTSTAGPNIRGIMPQADRMEVSEQEISSGKTFTVGANGNGGPSNVNISMEGSKSRKSTFKGVRIIHGAVRDRMHASWRLYEEPGSRSGLPEIVRLLLLVHSEAEFQIRLALSVKACHFLTFGIPRTLSAPAGASYTVPKLSVITAFEQESRLRQMLHVADRAAAAVEDTKRMEESFSQAMRRHKKRNLIMEAGSIENKLQEWTEILDDSKSNDFYTLQQKMVNMEAELALANLDERVLKRREERILIPDDPDSRTLERNDARVPAVVVADPRIPERLTETISIPRDDSDDSSSLPDRRRRRTSYIERERSPPRVYRRSIDPMRGMRRDYEFASGDPSRRRRGTYDDADYEPHSSRGRGKLEQFSAVGPGYHVSRLA